MTIGMKGVGELPLQRDHSQTMVDHGLTMVDHGHWPWSTIIWLWSDHGQMVMVISWSLMVKPYILTMNWPSIWPWYNDHWVVDHGQARLDSTMLTIIRPWSDHDRTMVSQWAIKMTMNWTSSSSDRPTIWPWSSMMVRAWLMMINDGQWWPWNSWEKAGQKLGIFPRNLLGFLGFHANEEAGKMSNFSQESLDKIPAFPEAGKMIVTENIHPPFPGILGKPGSRKMMKLAHQFPEKAGTTWKAGKNPQKFSKKTGITQEAWKNSPYIPGKAWKSPPILSDKLHCFFLKTYT